MLRSLNRVFAIFRKKMAKADINLVKEIATKTLRNAGNYIKGGFKSKLYEEKLKGFSDFQTSVDINVEKEIFRHLSESFPDWGFLGEENIHEKRMSEYFWVLDPVCSTNNFVFGLPLVGTALGLIRQDEVIAAFIYLPIFDDLLWAIKGSGTFLNNKSVKVSKRARLKDSMILYDNQFYKSDKMIPNLIKLSDKCFTMRITGSAAYDMFCVATGLAEARIFHKTKYYDFFPASLLIEESGGCVTTFRGEKASLYDTEILASNGLIHDEILQIVNL